MFELILLLFERELPDKIGSSPNFLILDSRKSEVLTACFILFQLTRGTEPAYATFINTFGPPESNPEVTFVFILDGLGTYDSASGVYNQQACAMTGRKTPVIETKTVVGLENKDEVSTKYRSLKQMIERLNRTCKFHTRPRNGFKDFDGAVTLPALFVAY